MGYLHQALVCLILMLPLANSELKSRRRDVTLISGKIMSLTGAGQYDLRGSIPGEPGVDYPIFSSPPETSFSCLNRHEGYYADVETRCQVFRICSHTDQTGKGFAFLCPNGTLFSQHDFVCDWYRNVACEASPNFYFMNELLDKAVSPHPELLMKDIVAMVNYPMKVMKQQKIFQNIQRQQQPPSSPPPPPPTFQQTTPKPIINFSFQKTPITPPPFTQPVRNPFQTESRYNFGRIPPSNPQPPQQPQFQRPLFRPTPQPEVTDNPERQPGSQQKPLFSTTSIPKLENPDNTNNYDSGRVYISSLGELSTDPGSNFDPKTAVIIPDKSQEQSPIFTQAGSQEHLLEGKLEPIPSDAHKNLLLNLESIASSIPGNINSQLALVPDQPQVQGSLVQLPGTLHVSLNYTQKINTALNNVLIPTAAQAQLAKNPILSADGKLVSEIYGQNQLQDNSGILKFAHNINSAFQVMNPLTEDTQPPSVFGQKLFNTNDLNNINGLSLQTDNLGSTRHGFDASGSQTPYGLDGRISFQSIPTALNSQAGQPFQYQQRQQGFNFNRNNAASSTPAPIIHRETIYIPSIGPKQYFSEDVNSLQTNTELKPILDSNTVNLQYPSNVNVQYSNTVTEQYPSTSTEQYLNAVNAQYPNTAAEQYPNAVNAQYSSTSTEQYPSAVNAQYQNTVTEQYPSAVNTQYPNTATEQYPNAVNAQYSSTSTEQYPSAVNAQYQNTVTEQYPSAVNAQYQNTVTEQYPSVVNAQYSSTATEQNPRSVTVQNAAYGPDYQDEDRDQVVAANLHYGTNKGVGGKRRNELNDRSHAKRAEGLLVQGLQLSAFDNAKKDLTIHDNSIDELLAINDLNEEKLFTTTQRSSEASKNENDGPLRINLGTDQLIQSFPQRTEEFYPLPQNEEDGPLRISLTPGNAIPTSSTKQPNEIYLSSTTVETSSIDPLELQLSSTPSFQSSTLKQSNQSQIEYTANSLEIDPLPTFSPTLPATTPITTTTLPTATIISSKIHVQLKTGKPRGRFVIRVRKNRLVKTTTIRPTDFLKSTSTDQTVAKPRKSFGVRAALDKSRNKAKKFTVLKRRKLTLSEATANNKNINNSTLVANLPKPRYTSTITSSAISTSSNNKNNNINNTANIDSQTDHRRHHQSTTHIIQKQTNPADVSLQRQTTSYINIPGTKIGIAKAIEEGHYSESSYPLRPNPMDQAKPIIFPNVVINPGTPFMARQRSFLMGPNLTLPSPNVSTAKPIIQTFGTISTTSPLAAFSFFNGISSTPIPSLTSIPLTAQPAEQRADLADDEEAFFRGISSYSVPLNSVGRLPADIQGIRKR